jgi:hypothetical protein
MDEPSLKPSSTSRTFRGNEDLWDEGEQAAQEGKTLLDNPVPFRCFAWRDWRRGYIFAYHEKYKTYP